MLIPFFNPWYWLWVLPFAVVKPSYWAWAASLMLLLSYGSGINNVDDVFLFALFSVSDRLEAYELPIGLMILEFWVIALALCFDGFRKRD